MCPLSVSNPQGDAEAKVKWLPDHENSFAYMDIRETKKIASETRGQVWSPYSPCVVDLTKESVACLGQQHIPLKYIVGRYSPGR